MGLPPWQPGGLESGKRRTDPAKNGVNEHQEYVITRRFGWFGRDTNRAYSVLANKHRGQRPPWLHAGTCGSGVRGGPPLRRFAGHHLGPAGLSRSRLSASKSTGFTR